ncbi:hypothetical protein [Micromonospora sp. NPDC093277]|uniref:hypothetical protein n=1 Tax=Micromonospora sp. NPDC093277 TaxID=3364291 RepID=UPI00380C3E03
MTNFEANFGYPPDENILVKADASSGTRVQELAAVGVTGDLLDLYSCVEKVSLPDAGNGLFIHSAEDVAEGVRGYQPTRLAGARSEDIVVFGSDGGGGLFAVSADDGSVYRLGGGSLLGQVYETDESGLIKIASDLWGFLEYLRSEVVQTIPPGWS